MKKKCRVVIIDYPGSFQTATHGLAEFFSLASDVDARVEFDVQTKSPESFTASKQSIDYLIVPPNMKGKYYLNPDERLLDGIRKARKKGGIVCSACAGAFIVAQSGIVQSETLTTHWQLAQQFRLAYPHIPLNVDKIVIDHGGIITAGGLMSWIDLAFHIIKRTCAASTNAQLRHFLIISTEGREQKSYKQFAADFSHSDEEVKKCQKLIESNFASSQTLAELAAFVHLTTRTLIRRFAKAVGMTPHGYIQSVRIQKACERLESTNRSIEVIANEVGYENVGAFRKVFIQKIGLKPQEFRQMHQA